MTEDDNNIALPLDFGRSSRGRPVGAANALFLLLGVVALCAFFSIFAKNFFTLRSALNLLVQTSTLTIVGIAALLVLIVGGIDFSLGAIVTLSGTAAVWLASRGLPIGISMAGGILLGGIIGLANGFLVAKLRLPSLLTTFAMAIFLYGTLGVVASLLRWGPLPEAFGNLANLPLFKIVARGANGAVTVIFPGISWLVVIMALVAVLAHFALSKTRLGRYAYLVGSNFEASRLSGIGAYKVKGGAFVAAGLLAGLVGILLASRMVSWPGGGGDYEVVGVICAMIGGASLSGGAGRVAGTVIGSFLLSIVSMGLTMMNANGVYVPLFVNGCIVLGAVYVDRLRSQK